MTSALLQDLVELKKRWLEKYTPFAFELCIAVLTVGQDDNLGDPVSMRRHGMKGKSCTSGDTRIMATEKSGSFVPELMDYSITRRLMVTVNGYQAVYLTFSNDQSMDSKNNNLFVPGVWMDFANQVMKDFKYHQELINQEHEIETISDLKSMLLIDVPGFGTSYEKIGAKSL